MPTKGTPWAEPGRSAHGPRLHLSPSNRTRVNDAGAHRTPRTAAPGRSFAGPREETERSATMVHVFIRHKVKDYGAWRQVFDGFAAKRRVEARWRSGSPAFPGSRTIFAFSSSGRVSRRPGHF